MTSSRLLPFLLVLVVASAFVAPVAAEHNSGAGNEATHTSTHSDGAHGSESDSTLTASERSENATTVVEEVDDRLRILSYRYDADASLFVITLEDTGRVGESHVTITEAISRQAAESGRFGIKSFTVTAGERVEIRLDVYTENPLGVMVTTRRSVEEGHGSFLPAGDGGGGQFIGGEPSGAHVRAGALAGGLGSILIMIGGAWQLVASKNDEVKDAELEPKTTLLGRLKDD